MGSSSVLLPLKSLMRIGCMERTYHSLSSTEADSGSPSLPLPSTWSPPSLNAFNFCTLSISATPSSVRRASSRSCGTTRGTTLGGGGVRRARLRFRMCTHTLKRMSVLFYRLNIALQLSRIQTH